MPRSTRDSDEDVDVKAGRKTRLTDVTSVDSPLRRSSRIKSAIKQNESSPESPSSDTSNVSNTQTRVTRRRTGTLDNATITEKQRVLRSRINSASSDINEYTEVDATPATPTRRSRSSIINDPLNKTSNRRSKRFTRAGSETTSPPPTRTTRNTRATSMEPETTTGNKYIERDESELMHMSRKTRRRTSILPSEPTVIEEKQEAAKLLRVSLERTLPNVKEANEMDLNSSSICVSQSDLPSNLGKPLEGNISVKESFNNPAENPASKSSGNIEKDASMDDNSIIPINDENVSEKNKNSDMCTVMQMETSICNLSQSFSQKGDQNTSKELGLKIENLLSNSMEKNEDFNNKENLIVNVTNDESSIENTISSTSLESPKPLFVNNSNKLATEKCKSPSNISSRNRHSRSLELIDNSIVSVKEDSNNDISVANNLVAENMDVSVNTEDTDNSDVQELIIETDSLSETTTNVSSDRNIVLKICTESSSDESIELVKCKENVQIVDSDDKFTKVDNMLDDKSKEVCSEKYNEIVIDAAISSVEETTVLHLEKTTISNIEETTISDLEKTTISNVEETTISNIEKTTILNVGGTTISDIEKTGISNVEETTISDVEKTTVSNVEETTISDVGKTTVSNVEETTISDVGKTTVSNVEETTISDVEKTGISNVEETTISNVGGTTNTNVDFKKDSIKQSAVANPKENMKEEVTELYVSENSQNDDKLHCTNSRLSLNLTNILPLTPKITTNKSPLIPNNKEMYESKSINKTNILSPDTTIVSESLSARMSPKDSVCTNAGEDSVTNVVKSSLSSTVTETSVELNEEIPKKGQSLNDSLMSKPQSTEKLGSDEQKSEPIQKICNRSQEQIDIDDNDSDINAEDLFQDIPADEWKEKSINSDKNSIHSTSTEKLENEVEAECDLVLVDKEAWLTAEAVKANKEKDVFDYDSDDTVMLKMQKDCVEAKNNEQMKMDISLDDNKMDISDNEIINKSNKQKSLQQNENIGGENVTESAEEDFRNMNQNKSITEQNKQSTPKQNLSLNKSNLTDSISEKRKTFNESVGEISDNETTKSNKIVSLINRKSLNKSDNKGKEAINELNGETVTNVSAKKNKERQSLNSSSGNKFIESNIPRRQSNATEKKHGRNCSTIRNIKDFDDSEGNSDDSRNKTIELPKFLLGEASDTDSDDDNESNKSINSDIEREYNLHGKSISKFSDDDVPGDECRASETESSDPDDNGSDLADFVVNDDEIEEDSEESENEELHSDEDTEENQRENKEETGQNEGMQTEKLNGTEKQLKESAIDKNTQNENQQENDEKTIDESMGNSIKRNSKLKISNRLSKSLTVENDVKKKKIKSTDTYRTVKSDKEDSLSDFSLSSSFNRQKKKSKRSSSEFIVEDIEQPLNESQSMFNKKMQKFSTSMECSTPKSHLSKSGEFDVSLKTSGTNQAQMSQTKNNAKKSSKLQSKDTDVRLSSGLVELVEKTNLSKPVSSKINDLNKTTLTPGSDTPTTKYLKKDKLNESAPILKLDNKFNELINTNDADKQNKVSNQIKEESEAVNASNIKISQKLSTSIKEKVLKIAENVLEADRRKKRKKQKQTVEETNPSPLIETNFCEGIDSETVSKSKRTVSTIDTNKNGEIEASCLKSAKKKKKKQKTEKVDINNHTDKASQGVTDTKSETISKPTIKKVKKKQGKEIIDVSDTYIDNQIPKKKKKKILHTLQNENITTTQISTKKQKLSSKNNILSNKETAIEKGPKKKKELALKDVSLQDEVPAKKLLNKKQNLLSTEFSQGENSSTEKLSRKKDKLLTENLKKGAVKSNKISNKLQKTNDKMSDSTEGPIAVEFSGPHDKVLKALKRTSDSTKTNKDIKKKKQKEHVEKMQRAEEFKNENLKYKKQEIKANETKAPIKGIKRLSDEVLENLSDVPSKPLKRRKLLKTEEQILPSRTMLDSKTKEIKDAHMEDFIPLSSCGGTTQFAVVNIQKIKKKKKKTPGVISFKQKMLARNSRQPVSAYLMYLEKQKASGKDKFCNKPY